MKFSQRKGYKPTPQPLPKDNISEDLRNSLWNVLDIGIWRTDGFLWNRYGDIGMEDFSRALWFAFFKKPIDTRPREYSEVLRFIREYFFTCKWYDIFDFLEFVLTRKYDPSVEIQAVIILINHCLEQELSPYRFINGVFTEVTDSKEVEMLEKALGSNEFPSVSAHLQRSLELLSDRKNPDFRNSIKESISAVESIAQIITENPKSTLGDALKSLEKSKTIHPALKEGFSKLYGYTSDADGIRHAMLEEPNIGIEDAKYFLLACTSFINYLKSKI
jgi:hypothetical protein